MHRSPSFDTTNWSLVLASMETAPARATDAMERLCKRCWFPVYAAIRRQGHDSHHAEDLTQNFFEFAIDSRLLQRARRERGRERGRFRSYILTSLQNFLHDHHRRVSAVKRGGRHHFAPLYETTAETILASETLSNGSNGDLFDRRWAVTLIHTVMESLRDDFACRDRNEVHDALLPYLTEEPAAGDYERIAAGLSGEPGTLRVAVYRFRHRFGELLRSEVAHTVSDPVDVQEEIRYLLYVLSDS